LSFVQLQCGGRIDIEVDPGRVRNIVIFGGQLPGQEYLSAILVEREVAAPKS
jgi:hypothetical protein